jgi:hypothetical protein
MRSSTVPSRRACLGRLVPVLLTRISNASAASRTFDTALRSMTSSSRESAESRLRYCSNGTFQSRHYAKDCLPDCSTELGRSALWIPARHCRRMDRSLQRHALELRRRMQTTILRLLHSLPSETQECLPAVAKSAGCASGLLLGHIDDPGLRIFLQASVAQFGSDAGLLVASEGYVGL